MQEFNRNMLPVLGVIWHIFATRKEAVNFSHWAESVTSNDEYPCDTDITMLNGKYLVKVVNW